MASATKLQTGRIRQSTISIILGLTATFLFFLGAGFIAYQNIETLRYNTIQVTRTHDTILALSEISSLLKDAETGQRGYVLTGDASYLAPYEAAIPAIGDKLKDIEGYTQNNTSQQASIVLLQRHSC